MIYFVGFGIQTDLGHSFRVIDKPAAERYTALLPLQLSHSVDGMHSTTYMTY